MLGLIVPLSASPATAELAVELACPVLLEALPAGALDVGPVPVPRARVAGRVGLGPGWELGAHLAYMEYTLVDRQAPDSRHHRDDFDFGGLLAGRLPIAGVEPWLGVGYAARFVSVASNQAPALAQPLLFSPAQLFHGPRVAAGWQGALGRGFALELEGGFRPYMFAAGDLAVSSLAPLYGYDALAAVTFAQGPRWSARCGLAYEGMGAYYNDFRHATIGPAVRGSWSF